MALIERSDLLAGEALPIARLVRIDATAGFMLADASDTDAYGVTLAACNSGDAPQVWPLSRGGHVMQCTSASAFAVRVILFQANDGKVDDAGTVRVGVALAAAAGANEVVEVALLP
jgi:hypothetical protein